MTPTAANQNIIKMSYGKTHFKAFLDIDFSQTPAYSQMFFDNLFPIPFGSLLFVAQSHLQFIDEKIFFKKIEDKVNFIKSYFEKLEEITIPAFKVNIRVHNLLRKFIIEGDLDID